MPLLALREVRDPERVFSRTLDRFLGNAGPAEASLAEEAAAALDATDKDVATGSAGLNRGGDRARTCRRAAHVPQSGRHRCSHTVPAAGHRTRPTGLITLGGSVPA